MDPVHLERYRSEGVFRHKFENVWHTLSSKQTMESNDFHVRNIAWSILLVPKFNSQNNQLEFIGCFLKCIEMEWADISCKTNFKLTVLNLPKPNPQQNEDFQHTFIRGANNWGYPQFLAMNSLPPGYFANNDSLTIQVELKAELPQGMDYCYQTPKASIKRSLEPVTVDGLADSMGDLFDSGDGADVSFIISKDNTRIRAHKNILSVRNDVFRAMFSLQGMTEAETKEVKIEDMGHAALNILLRHIYTGRLAFPKEDEMDAEICEEVVHFGQDQYDFLKIAKLNYKVVNGAEQYGLPELKEYAGMALAECALTMPGNAVEMYKFVKARNVEGATKALRSYIKGNTEDILNNC